MPCTKIVPAIHAAFATPERPTTRASVGPGNAGVELEVAHVAVVQQVVLAERDRAGHDERQVRENRDQPVRRARAEDEIVEVSWISAQSA